MYVRRYLELLGGERYIKFRVASIFLFLCTFMYVYINIYPYAYVCEYLELLGEEGYVEFRARAAYMHIFTCIYHLYSNLNVSSYIYTQI